jgi:hypothetical protein
MRRLSLAALALGLLALCGCDKIHSWFSKATPVVTHLPTAVPTPSPDKDAIAYVRNGQIWMMKWDGSGAGPLLALKDASLWFPSASPKGDDLLAWMSRGDGSEDVVRVGLDGRYEILTSMGERASSTMKNLRLGNAPMYDSQASRIAYSYNGRIWIMSRDGYDAQTLIADGLSYAPVWSPDDKKIAYVNGKNGHFDLWVTDVTSRDTWQVTDFQGYTVGQPRWVADGKRLMVTRSQKDESDVVSVLADTDVPLVDADVLTKDHASAAGTLNQDGKYIAYSSAGGSLGSPDQETAQVWDIWTGDAAFKEIKKLSVGGGGSPTWIRPTVPSAVMPAVVAALPTPTAVMPAQPMALPKPQAAMAPPAAPPVVPAQPRVMPTTMVAAAPAPQPTPRPAQAMASSPAQAVPPRPAPPASAPSVSAAARPAAPAAAAPAPAVAMARPAQVSPAPVNARPAPTQPPVKAPPLRMRLRVSVDPDTDLLVMSSMPELRKTASRVKQYSGESILLYGPLDRSPLRGRYTSEDDRSQARAEQVAAQLAKEAGLPPSQIKALAYAPVVIGAVSSNGIEIHVELK